MKKYLWGALVLVVLLAAASFAVNAQTTARDLSGWAWSSNIGWVSFNSQNTGAGGGSYKVQLEADGDLVGYAWSSNIGWIKFGNLTSIPQDGTNARVLSGTNVRNVVGWVRACGGTVNADCNSATRTDGWDGWINLADEEFHSTGIADGSGGVTYVVTHDTESNTDTATLEGYAWGGDVVGWLKFSPTTGVDTVVTPDGNSDTLTFTVAGVTTSSETPRSAVIASNSNGEAVASISWSSTGGYYSCSAGLSTSGSTVTGWSGSKSSSGTGSATFTGVLNGGQRDLLLTCLDSMDVATTRTVQVTVSPYSAPTLSCVQPNHALQCSDTTNATFIYTSTTENPIPSGTPPQTIMSSCPGSGINYCVYYCENNYKPNGNRCTRSDIEEI